MRTKTAAGEHGTGITRTHGRLRPAARARLLVAAVVASFLVALAGASPASAARSERCVYWGCGSITWTWKSSKELNPLSLSIRDTGCDDKSVYISLEIDPSSGSNYFVGSTKAGGGCHATKNTVKNTYYKSSKSIVRARAVFDLCENSFNCNETIYGAWVNY